jgi:hypothetical protein
MAYIDFGSLVVNECQRAKKTINRINGKSRTKISGHIFCSLKIHQVLKPGKEYS